MVVRKEKSIFFTRKEELDFVRLCTIHGFKKRDIVKDNENRVIKFEIYLYSIVQLIKMRIGIVPNQI